MESSQRRLLKAVVLELRHLLEGWYDEPGQWHPGDLEQRLASIGVRRNREPVRLDELPHLSESDRRARSVVEAYLQLRRDAGIPLGDAVAEFVRETAYTWANRLLALRCMESRELIDEVILQKEVYGGRSLEHNRLARRQPDLCAGEDDGLFALLDQIFARQAQALPRLFDPLSPGVALRPSPAILKDCVGLLSLKPDILSKCRIRQPDAETQGVEIDVGAVFRAPDALGWAYQYWNMEAKERVFERMRTEKGAKIQGADIIPATQLYTEDYMVKFLVQNSLGTLWMGMHPQSGLCGRWEYYVSREGGAHASAKSVLEVTFLDPAMGSAHFHLEAFDLLYAMYEEEGQITTPRQICAAILNNNLFGIDIDERAVQIGIAALWMKARDKAPDMEPSDLSTFHNHFAATNIRLPKGKDHLLAFLAKHPEDKVLGPALEVIFDGLQHADEIGSLLRIEEPVEKELQHLKGILESRRNQAVQPDMFTPTPQQGELPVGIESFSQWKQKTLTALKHHFADEAESADLAEAFFSRSVNQALAVFELLSMRYDVVAANPPYLGSKRQGDLLKSYLSVNYPLAQYDLYTCFLVRARDMLSAQGVSALVTRSTWLFQSWYAELRCVALHDGFLRLLVKLGTGAFEDFGGDVVDVVLQVMSARPQEAMLVASLAKCERKAEELRAICAGRRLALQTTAMFSELPGKVISPDLTEGIARVFMRGQSLKHLAKVTDSVVVVSRFLRFWWETPEAGSRWVSYSKGGSVDKWMGKDLYSLDWACGGVRLKSYVLNRYPPSKFRLIVKEEGIIGRPCLTWTTHCSGTLAVRRMDRGGIVSSKGPGVFCEDENVASVLLGLMNSSIGSALMQILSPGSEFGYKYVAEMPVPEVNQELTSQLRAAVSRCVEAKQACVSKDPIERDYSSPEKPIVTITTVPRYLCALERDYLDSQLALLESEGALEDLAANAYGLLADDVQAAHTITGTHPWFFARKSLRQTEADHLLEVLEDAPFESSVDDDAEPPDSEREEASDADAASFSGGARSAQTIPLGKLAVRLSVHPSSIHDAVLAAIESGHLASLTAANWAKRIISVLVLKALGHRWPREIDAGVPLFEWADPDGVIPVSQTATETVLTERIRRHLAKDFPSIDAGTLEREFGEIIGTRMEDWITTGFALYHARQFKKRPVAWHLESSGGPRKKPAFSCFLYYRRVDGDMLPKIRSQYAGPLVQRSETELRGIVDLPANSRNDRQERRRIELEDTIRELRTLDSTLEAIVQAGFGPDRLVPKLRQFAIDDAWHCKKGQWLVRLEQQARTGALPQWKDKAATLALHDDLPCWIDEAFTRLDFFCAAVGSPPPKANDLESDPSASDISASIHDQAPEMLSSAISLACGRWWKQYDDIVLLPIRTVLATDRKEMTAVTEEKKTCEDRDRRAELELRRRELKAQIAVLKEQLDEKTEPAKTLRQQIEQWSHPDAAKWADGLATTPMYDAISSVDGERPPPLTVQDFIRQESRYVPDINDGVRVNIAPLQKAGILAADVLAAKDVDKAIEDRADWRADERRWVREGKLPQPGWWREG